MGGSPGHGKVPQGKNQDEESITILQLKGATEIPFWTSPVGQWLRIRPPMQGTRIQALVQEDPTCRGATKPVCHNY